VRCAGCGAGLPAPPAPPTRVGARSPGRATWRARLLPLGIAVAFVTHSDTGSYQYTTGERITETITPPRLAAHAEAVLRYPDGMLLATTVMTGTTMLVAIYETNGCFAKSTNCHDFVGYDTTSHAGPEQGRVNGGYVWRLFATRDGMG
jgi:hypothetical protein